MMDKFNLSNLMMDKRKKKKKKKKKDFAFNPLFIHGYKTN